jgi:hypothetical protein
MKKLFLFIYLVGIAAYFGYSQMSLSLSDSTGPIANNSIIYKSGTPTDDELVSFVFVTNNSANSIPVIVRKVVLDTIAGSINMFCWGSCFASTVYLSPTPISILPGRTDSTNFSGHYVPNTYPGVSRMRYVFFNRSNQSDSVCVNIYYSAFPLGTETLSENGKLSNAFPNPANNYTTISYSLTGAESGSMIIRNIVGSVVKEVPLNGDSEKASIFTGDLSEGVYFYSLHVEGKMDISRKLIVRH